jgi:serine phosphatase RsbU (regulator of sigma subunit)
MAAVAAADLGTGPGLGFLPLLSLGPALAAVWLTPRGTVLVGALAVALCLPLSLYDGVFGSRRTAVAIAAVVGVTCASVVASVGRLRRERDLAEVKAVADTMQRVLLRPVRSPLGGLDIGIRYTSASTSAQVGGDLYEVARTSGAVRLIVADVQGQGLAAVGTAAIVLGAFRESAYDAANLAAIAARIESSLARHETDEEFVTAILAEFPDDGLAMELLNCGHPPPLLLSGGTGKFLEPADPGLPLGLAQLQTCVREPATFGLAAGDRVLFYTDGISEARSRSGAFYPLDLSAGLLRNGDVGSALDRLGADLASHVGHPLRDDATAVLIARRPLLPGSSRTATLAASLD